MDRYRKKMKKLLFSILAIGLYFLFASSCYKPNSTENLNTDRSYKNWDTVISNKAYVSFYSQKLKNPVAVLYKLYKGGGPCSRSGFRFVNDLNIKTAKDDDYLRSGYDKGHMANAEDFANNCELDEMTFRFYNCVPQKPELNRGPWRSLESKIRDNSQSDSLLVFCINIYRDTLINIGKSKVVVPTFCIKGAKRMRTSEWVILEEFTNTSVPSIRTIKETSEIFAKYGVKVEDLERLFYERRKL